MKDNIYKRFDLKKVTLQKAAKLMLSEAETCQLQHYKHRQFACYFRQKLPLMKRIFFVLTMIKIFCQQIGQKISIIN